MKRGKIMNNNVNNNDQEMILRQKIEKREKFDTILAYILLVVLLGCIGVVLGLKFLGGEEEVPPVDEYTPSYISLGEIATSLNGSVLANRYMNDGASFATSVNGNALMVTYIKEDVNVNIEMPMVGSELMISVPVENSEIVTDVYKEIANTVCVYYGNLEKNCRYTLDNMGENSTNGIRIDNTGDNSVIYVDTTKSFSVMEDIIYRDVVVSDIDDTDYVLELFDVRVSNINIVNTDTSVTFSGNVDRISEDTSNVSVNVKLYDVNGNVLGENKYEYNEENVLESTGTFEVGFLLSDTLKLENIDKYSIEIVK